MIIKVRRITHKEFIGNNFATDGGWLSRVTRIGLYLFGFIRIKTYYKYHISKCGHFYCLKETKNIIHKSRTIKN